MATPRKRYFKCADQILAEPWTRDQKLTLVLLMAHLNTRWARDGIPDEFSGDCVLSEGALRDITGKKRLRSGYEALRELSGLVSVEVSLRDGFVSVRWPKYAEFQHADSPSRGKVRPRVEPPPQPQPQTQLKPEPEQPGLASSSAGPAGSGAEEGRAKEVAPPLLSDMIPLDLHSQERSVQLYWQAVEKGWVSANEGGLHDFYETMAHACTAAGKIGGDPVRMFYANLRDGRRWPDDLVSKAHARTVVALLKQRGLVAGELQ